MNAHGLVNSQAVSSNVFQDVWAKKNAYNPLKRRVIPILFNKDRV